MSDDDAEVAALSAHYLKLAYKANGQIPVKIEILSTDHSLDSVRSTYKAWFIDPSRDDSFDDPRPTIHWEEGVAHFFREGITDFSGTTVRFVPKQGCEWKHNYNSVKEGGIRDLDGPFLDDGVAEGWRRLKELLALGVELDELPM
jgi:hypothetical protein